MSYNTSLTPVTASRQAPTWLMVVAGILIPSFLTYFLSTANENVVLAAVVGLLGIGCIFARPLWGLIFFVGLLYIRPEETIRELQGMRFALIISLCTLVALFFHTVITKTPIKKTPANLMIGGFGLAVILSSLPNGNTDMAVTDITKLVILVFLIINIIDSPKKFEIFATAIIICTTYLSIYSIYQYNNGGALSYQDMTRSKGTGIFSDPNDLAATIISGMALILMRLRKPGLSRIFYFLIMITTMYAVFLTESRGGMLGLLAVICGFLFFSTKNRGVAMGIAGVIGLALLVFGPSRMTSFDSGEESANSRFWFWVTGVEALMAKPLLGVGYGIFPSINDNMTAHNSFVLCFSETGLIGYFFWMGLIYYCFKKIGGGPLDLRDPAQGNRLAARLTLVGFLVSGFFISRTYIPVLYIIFSLPIAQYLAYRDKDAPEQALPNKKEVLHIIGVCLASIAFIYALALKLR